MGLAGVLVVRPADFAPAPRSSARRTRHRQRLRRRGRRCCSPTSTRPFAQAPDTYDLRKFNGDDPPHQRQGLPEHRPDRVARRAKGPAPVRERRRGQPLDGRARPAAERRGIGAPPVDRSGPAGRHHHGRDTEDAVVTVPAGGGSGHRRRWTPAAASTPTGATGARRQLLFGGMLTFIQYNPVAATTDTVGPTSTITSPTHPFPPDGRHLGERLHGDGELHRTGARLVGHRVRRGGDRHLQAAGQERTFTLSGNSSTETGRRRPGRRPSRA